MLFRSSDPSVCTIWGFRENKWYLLDLLRDRLDYPELKRTVIRLHDEWGADRVIIEKAGSGIPLLQEIHREHSWRAWPFQPTLDKEVRFRAACARIEAGELDAAFQAAQQAKALAVGRTLTVPPGSRPHPLSEAGLIASKLMSTGAGGEDLISQKELFIEYFYGPTRAWAFYVFAPGDNFRPLRVVELDRAQFASHCAAAIESAKKGEPLAGIGDWILAGRDGTTLSALWDQLGEVKKPEPLFRRVVISPDGPLCYVPLHDAGPPRRTAFAAVTCLPTAAVLKSADFIAARDVRLMWDQQRSSFSEQ